ncbi:MAG: hypothetical protein ACJ711_04545, partial [Ornithinibacter sp.]
MTDDEPLGHAGERLHRWTIPVLDEAPTSGPVDADLVGSSRVVHQLAQPGRRSLTSLAGPAWGLLTSSFSRRRTRCPARSSRIALGELLVRPTADGR